MGSISLALTLLSNPAVPRAPAVQAPSYNAIPSPGGTGADGGSSGCFLKPSPGNAKFTLRKLMKTPTRKQDEEQRLREFLEEFHGELIRARPDLFLKKMEKAAASDRVFYRAFPQLYYQILSRQKEAKILAATRRLLLAGDIHPDNTELVDYKDGVVLQPNDFDDAGVAPSAVEIARMLGGAGLLGGRSAAERRDRIADAAKGYRAALKDDFKEWARKIQDEKAIDKAVRKDRDWAHNAGVQVRDPRLKRRLLTAAGLNGKEWRVFDRAGAGGSSIGVRRYMFVHRNGRAWELKQLRPSALSYFGDVGGPKSDRARVGKAYEQLRKVPAEARTFRWEGTDWVLRLRERFQLPLNYEKAASASRVIGGMTARMHARLADPADLKSALEAVSPQLVLESLRAMDRMRAALKRLLKEGVLIPHHE